MNREQGLHWWKETNFDVYYHTSTVSLTAGCRSISVCLAKGQHCTSAYDRPYLSGTAPLDCLVHHALGYRQLQVVCSVEVDCWIPKLNVEAFGNITTCKSICYSWWTELINLAKEMAFNYHLWLDNLPAIVCNNGIQLHTTWKYSHYESWVLSGSWIGNCLIVQLPIQHHLRGHHP